MQKEHALAVHPAGEEQFEFVTPGGRIALRPSDEALTPYGGLVPFAAFLKHLGIVETLAATCPVERTSPNARPVAEIVQSFMLTALADGRRFAHVERLREDPALSELFGMKRVVGADTIRRLLASIGHEPGAKWLSSASAMLWQALPDQIILDWDSTVQTKYGHQEGAAIGYNPTKPGRRSVHPLMAIAAGTRLCTAYQFRNGDTVTASQWTGAMEEAQRWLEGKKIWLNRGDIGLGHEAIMRWHESEAGRPHYLFKLKQTKNVRKAIHAMKESQWEGPLHRGAWQVAEAEIKLEGWSRPRRVVVARKTQGKAPADNQAEMWKVNRYDYAVYVTNLDKESINAWQVMGLYRERADAENVFDEIKNQWGFNGFMSAKKAVSALAGQLLLLVYNLWSLYMRLVEPGKHTEAVTSRRWFLLMAGRLVQSGRQKALALSVQGRWWEELKEGYKRVLAWLRTTAPQLKQWVPQPPPLLPAQPSLLPSNCGF
jgi:hypothetical protein